MFIFNFLVKLLTATIITLVSNLKIIDEHCIIISNNIYYTQYMYSTSHKSNYLKLEWLFNKYMQYISFSVGAQVLNI